MLEGTFTPLAPEVPDETLVARARDGARAAFAELVSRYQGSVYRLAFRMSRNASDAEEITQETFLLAHRGIGSFQGESRFRTWLYRITVNQALMMRRSARRRPVQPLDPSLLSAVARPSMPGVEPPEGAESLVDRKALIERVQWALAQLDEAQRAALVLRDLEELSSEESAQILGVTPDTVRQRAHRARLRMRELLEGSSGPHELLA